MRQAVDEKLDVQIENGRLVLNGFELPHIYVDARDGGWVLHSGYGDTRKTIELRSQEELDKWVPFIANVVATTDGFTGFGQGASPLYAGAAITGGVPRT